MMFYSRLILATRPLDGVDNPVAMSMRFYVLRIGNSLVNGHAVRDVSVVVQILRLQLLFAVFTVESCLRPFVRLKRAASAFM